MRPQTYAGRLVPQLEPPLYSEHRWTCPDWELEYLYVEIPAKVALGEQLRYRQPDDHPAEYRDRRHGRFGARH